MRMLRQLESLFETMPPWAQWAVGAFLLLFSIASVVGRFSPAIGAKVFSRIPPERLRKDVGHILAYTVVPLLVTVGYLVLLVGAQLQPEPEKPHGPLIIEPVQGRFNVGFEVLDEEKLRARVRSYLQEAVRPEVRVIAGENPVWHAVHLVFPVLRAAGLPRCVLTNREGGAIPLRLDAPAPDALGIEVEPLTGWEAEVRAGELVLRGDAEQGHAFLDPLQALAAARGKVVVGATDGLVGPQLLAVLEACSRAGVEDIWLR